MNAAFEGPAHPHKANILKYPGEKLLNLPKEPERIQPEPAFKESDPSELPAR